MQSITLTRWAIALALVAGSGACSDKQPTDIEPSILRGLTQGESNDTTTSTPPPPTQATPGAFHGFVLGPGTPPDTFATAPRLQGVAVAAYPLLGWQGQNPEVGDAAASMVTDANGAFQSPTIPGGEYIITFVPPRDGIHRGVYVTAVIHDGSDTGTWWVILPRK